MAGRLLATLGALLLIHCIYSVVKYRNVLKLTQQEFVSLPPQLGLEVAAGAALSLLGGFALAGGLKPIVITSGASMDAGALRPDFVYFNHRGKALPINLAAS